MKVYLAGNINGLTYEQATQWRIDATKRLCLLDIGVFDPMRTEANHPKEGTICDLELVDNHLGAKVFHSDIYMINQSDIILANFQMDSSTDEVSIGTFVEIGYAWGKGKHIIVISNDRRICKHPFIVQTSVVVHSYAEAETYLRNIKERDVFPFKKYTER